MISMKITGGEDVMRRLKACGINTVRAIVGETQRTALEMENYAKDNRPWTDRTGEARRRLYAVAETSVKDIKIRHGHGVEYGVNLETSHGGKYRIIAPTVERYRTIWIKNLKDTLRG